MKFLPDPGSIKKVLLPGLWIDTLNQLHFDAEAFVEGQGKPVTAENILSAEHAMQLAVTKLFPGMKYTVLADKPSPSVN